MIERLLADYKGIDKGPLLIVIAGLHGNEMAGIDAVEILSQMLVDEEQKDPSFRFRGRFVGIAGNIPALSSGKRMIDLDLNRIWLDDRQSITNSLEYQEMNSIQKMIHSFVSDHTINEPIFIMDLHTTSSPRGIFAVCTNSQNSKKITGELHCPVITNMTEQLRGSMIQYYMDHTIEGRKITSFAFEGGQHDDENSISRLIAGMVNCMRSIGAVLPQNVESRHDVVLQEYAAGLPKFCKITYIHKIEDAHLWKMKPDYYGFQTVKKDEIVANYDGKDVAIPHDALLLMPLYQDTGKEGFFLVNEE